MEPSVYDAFWSYAHDDNDRQQGRLSELSLALRDEFALITGDELDLFLDRESIEWGDAWRSRIEEALGNAPFLIAIVTPRYVRSPECRKEFLAFSRESTSRGVGKLLLPILYIDTEGIDEDSDDEMLAIIARTEWIDWRALRLKRPDSEEVLEGVHKIAERIRKLRSEVASTRREQEKRSDEQNFESVADIVAAIDEKLSGWMESVEFDHIAGAQWSAVLSERLDRIGRLRAGKQPQGAILAVYKRLGLELLPIAQDRLEKARVYSRLTIELDPLVTAAIRLVRDFPALSESLNPLRDGVVEAYLNIVPPILHSPVWDLPDYVLKYSRSLADADRSVNESLVYVNEANDIVLRWRSRLAELDGMEVEGPRDVAELFTIFHRDPVSGMLVRNTEVEGPVARLESRDLTGEVLD